MKSLGRAGQLLLTVFTVAAVASCLPKAGTDVGNGLTVKLNLQATPELAAKQEQAKALASGVVIDELWVTTVKFRLTPGADCESPDPGVDIPGPAFADLLGPGFVGGSRMFETMTDTFCKLSFEFDEAKGAELPVGAPPELADAALFMRGHRADGVVFTVRSRAKDSVKLDAKDGSFELDGEEHALVVGFDLDAATTALALDTLPGDPIVVDDKTNASALKAFEKAIRTSAKLFDDDDEDGKLSPAEANAEHELGHGGPE